jgi:flagellar basal-body rod modification protein FlgD
MSTVNSTASGSVPQSLLDAMNPKATTTAADTVKQTTDNFMQLLVTQMKNQDPLNPMDNAQVTSQLAQLSTVTGINKLNTTLETMLSGYGTSQSLQAASMIGHGVLVPDNGVVLASGQAVMGVQLTGSAESVVVSVKDASGREVTSIDLGPHAAGTFPLSWDGSTKGGEKAADGKYTFEVKATKAGSAVSASTLGYAAVNSVSIDATGVKLNLTNNSTVGLTDVRQIL